MAVIVRFLDLQVAVGFVFCSVDRNFSRFGIGFYGLAQFPKVNGFVCVTVFAGYGNVTRFNIGDIISVFLGNGLCRNVGDFITVSFEFRTRKTLQVLREFDS